MKLSENITQIRNITKFHITSNFPQVFVRRLLFFSYCSVWRLQNHILPCGKERKYKINALFSTSLRYTSNFPQVFAQTITILSYIGGLGQKLQNHNQIDKEKGRKYNKTTLTTHAFTTYAIQVISHKSSFRSSLFRPTLALEVKKSTKPQLKKQKKN